MSKLLELKDWLTLKEASHYLTTKLKEKVKTKDIYRLALENKITLSLLFINTTYIELANDETNKQSINFKGHYQKVQAGACYDLVNKYTSKLILKQRYFNDISIPLRIESQHNQGIVCLLPNKLGHGRLIHYSKNSRPLSQVAIAPSLPKDIKLVIKTPYLLDFIQRLIQPVQPPLELHNKERVCLYQLIAILATFAKLPINHSYKTADLIRENIAPQIGLIPPSRETIAKHLKAAYHGLS